MESRLLVKVRVESLEERVLHLGVGRRVEAKGQIHVRALPRFLPVKSHVSVLGPIEPVAQVVAQQIGQDGEEQDRERGDERGHGVSWVWRAFESHERRPSASQAQVLFKLQWGVRTRYTRGRFNA